METLPQPNPQAPLKSFTLFPHLPSEMRLKIWGQHCQAPRTIQLRYRMLPVARRSGKIVSTFSGWYSPDPVPAILHTCQESRSEALNYYHLAFATDWHPSNVYFNYAVDTLYFGRGSSSEYLVDAFLGYACAVDSSKLERVVLDIDEALYGRRTFCWDEVRFFESLKELTLVSYDADEQRESLMRHFRTTLKAIVATDPYPKWTVPQINVVSGLTKGDWGSVDVEGEGGGMET